MHIISVWLCNTLNESKVILVVLILYVMWLNRWKVFVEAKRKSIKLFTPSISIIWPILSPPMSATVSPRCSMATQQSCVQEIRYDESYCRRRGKDHLQYAVELLESQKNTIRVKVRICKRLVLVCGSRQLNFKVDNIQIRNHTNIIKLSVVYNNFWLNFVKM